MSRGIKWIIEDNVVAVYLAMHGDQNLTYRADEIKDIISNTLFLKKGFEMRVQNYRYILSGGKDGLHAGYPEGFPLYKELCSICESFPSDKFRDYINMILNNRKKIGRLSE